MSKEYIALEEPSVQNVVKKLNVWKEEFEVSILSHEVTKIERANWDYIVHYLIVCLEKKEL